MVAAGSQPFTTLSIAKETNVGTSVATTRELYPDGTGCLEIDRMRTFHEGANRGIRTNVTHATQQGFAVRVPFRTASDVGLAWDELIYMGSGLMGGATGVGAQADKTWTFTPVQTASTVAQESWTIEVGDNIASWTVDGCYPSRFRISAATDELTQGEIDWFGQGLTKEAATVVASNNGVKIPGGLWSIKTAASQAGLTAAVADPFMLLAFDLDVDTGLRPRKYMDGTLEYGRASLGRLDATLSLTVESTAAVVAEFYDKSAADTMSFIRLKAIGPVLGGSFYSCQIDLAVFYDDVRVIGSQDEGMNLYEVTARLAYDSVWANAMSMIVVNTLAALP